MNNKTKIHPAYLLLMGFLVLSLIIIGYYQDKNTKEIDIGGIKINQKDFNSITKPLPEGEYILCSIKDNGCVVGIKKLLE